MLIDWELAGKERRFEIRLPDVLEGSLFYRDILGAEETFSHQDNNGELTRIGLTIGNIGFILSSEAESCMEGPSLSLLAKELETEFVAIILYVEDPDRIAHLACEAGSKLAGTPESEGITLITDPYGSHWALAKRIAAASQACIS